MASKARRRLVREGLEPAAPAGKSRHAALPGTRAQRRRLRSRQRAARHQAEVAATGTADPVVAAEYRADVPPPPGGAVATVPLRPAVARTLDAEAGRIGIDRDRYCTIILEEVARSVTRRGAGEDGDAVAVPDVPDADAVPSSGPAAASAPTPTLIPSGYVGASDEPAASAPTPAPLAPEPVSLVPSTPGPAAPRLLAALAESEARRYWFPAAAALLLVVLAGAAIWNYGLVERYVFSGRAGDAVFLLDRWTGRVWTCTATAAASQTPSCYPVQLRAPAGERVVATLGALDRSVPSTRSAPPSR